MRVSLYPALLALCLCLPSCKGNTDTPAEKDNPEVPVTAFAKGADVSWCTEMEKRGYKFYDNKGVETECIALMKRIGFNAIRLRVWVNPKDGWCGKEDVLVKARRAHKEGMKLMIDFHYSDSWADPGKQNVPAAWKSYDQVKMAAAVADHTVEVLSALKSEGIDIAWVSVGNEVEGGMLWPSGKVSGQSTGSFVAYLNAGYDAVKKVYPQAEVILHISNAHKLDNLRWFYSLVSKNGAKFDMIGLSLYPSYWENGGFPDWKNRTTACVTNLQVLHNEFSKPVILCEIGMPASQPAQAKEMIQYLFDNTKYFDWFKGIFYWEPESEKSRNGYDYGAFENGRATVALDPFGSNRQQ